MVIVLDGVPLDEGSRRSEKHDPAATVSPRPAVGDGLVTCRGFERMRERVPQVERLPRAAVVRVAQAERRLEGRAPAHELLVGKLPERLAGEEARLDDLREPFAALFRG